MVTLTHPEIVTPTYTGMDRRRRAHISDSQFDEIVEKVSDSDRLRRIDDRLRAIDIALERGSERMACTSGSVTDIRAQVDVSALELAANTAATQAIARDTQEIRELLETGRALFRFASGFGTFARWLAGLIAACAAIWAAWHNVSGGGKPPGG